MYSLHIWTIFDNICYRFTVFPLASNQCFFLIPTKTLTADNDGKSIGDKWRVQADGGKARIYTPSTRDARAPIVNTCQPVTGVPSPSPSLYLRGNRAVDLYLALQHSVFIQSIGPFVYWTPTPLYAIHAFIITMFVFILDVRPYVYWTSKPLYATPWSK